MTDLERTINLMETIKNHSFIKNISVCFNMGTQGYGIDKRGCYVYGNTGNRISSNPERVSKYLSYLERDFRWKLEKLAAKGK